MCERCLMQADTNRANAQAIKELADAAAILSNHVAGSSTAISNIVDRIEKMAEMPREDKAEPASPDTSAKAEESKLPTELQSLKKLLSSMGIDAEFIEIGGDKPLH